MNIIYTGTIPADSLDTVTERVNKVAKRAAKVGFPAPVLTFGNQRREQKGSDKAGAPVYVEVVDITVSASDPLRLAGWTFIGTVSAILVDGKVEPMTTMVPGVDIHEVYVPKQVNWCDHCKTQRDRKDTYLVTDGTDWKQVGSSCLLDFTGHGANEIVPYFEALGSLNFGEDEVGSWYASSVNWYKPSDVLMYAARIVSKVGYISKQKAEVEYKSSTGEEVRNFLTATGKVEKMLNNDYPADEAAETLYNATLEAIEASVSDNEWEADVVRLAKADGIQWRHVGILASGVILGLRKQERKAQATAKGESHFIGQVGDRITLPVKVTLVREFEGQYGPTFIIRMLANESDELVWFASWSEKVAAIREGDEFTIAGTVKKQELDRRTDRPTTHLTRCKIGA